MNERQRNWLSTSSVLAAAGLLLAACSGSSSSSSTSTQSVSEDALSTTHDATDAPELAGALVRLADGPRDEGVEAWRCDPNPTITTVNVCGKDFPATLHFNWTQCALPRGHAADPRPCGGPGLPDGGGPLGDGGAPADAPSSSGTVDITNTITSADCSDGGSLTFAESTAFTIDRSDPRRGAQHLAGTTQSRSTHALDATSFTKSSQLDVTRTETATDGTTGTMKVSGALDVTFDESSGTPLRTVSGQLSLASDSGTDTATLTSVVREPPRACRTPVSGTIVYAQSDGTSHTLAFGPTCGSATLDGTAITLDGPGHGGHDGPPPPQGSTGSMH